MGRYERGIACLHEGQEFAVDNGSGHKPKTTARSFIHGDIVNVYIYILYIRYAYMGVKCLYTCSTTLE